MAERIGVQPAARARKPTFATTDANASHPYLAASAMFLLVFHTQRWVVLGGKLVPSLAKVPLIAGCNGVEIEPPREDGSGGRIVFAECLRRLTAQGRTVIPYEWAPDGDSYVQVLDTRPEGKQATAVAHITVWETATVGSSVTISDDEAYAEWLDGLVSAGKLPACGHDVAARMLDQVLGRLARERRHERRARGGSQGHRPERQRPRRRRREAGEGAANGDRQHAARRPEAPRRGQAVIGR